jgi:hypothetical protein
MKTVEPGIVAVPSRIKRARIAESGDAGAAEDRPTVSKPWLKKPSSAGQLKKRTPHSGRAARDYAGGRWRAPG